METHTHDKFGCFCGHMTTECDGTRCFAFCDWCGGDIVPCPDREQEDQT